jgi:hypothetical protein
MNYTDEMDFDVVTCKQGFITIGSGIQNWLRGMHIQAQRLQVDIISLIFSKIRKVA